MTATRDAPPTRLSGSAETNTPPPEASGDYRCCHCGFEIASVSALPACPACHLRRWHLVAWRPFSGGGRMTVTDGCGGAHKAAHSAARVR
jgi:hypothetical protein